MNLTAFWPRSLGARVTLYTLILFLVGVWSLAFYASRSLRDDMERVLGEAQLSTVTFIASAINTNLRDRFQALETIAAGISPALLADPRALQTLLESQATFQGQFNGGTFVTRTEGIAIASLPLSAKRLGVNYSDRDYMIASLKDGKAAIGRPVIGRALRSPTFAMAVPIRDRQGKVIGALAGVTDLAQPNFLDEFTGSRYGQTGGYLLVAPQHELIVTATDKTRIMAAIQANWPPVKGSTSRFIHGYEGTDVVVNQLGSEVLASAKRIPVAGWYIAASLPTVEAFSPIVDMQRRVLLATLLLTVLAGALTGWFLQRQFAAMRRAARSLARMTEAGQPLAPLTNVSDDEVGQLIGAFNRAVSALQASEERYRAFTNATTQVRYCMNPDWSEMRLLHGESFLADTEAPNRNWLQEYIHPDDQPQLLEAIREAVRNGSIFEREHRVVQLDGTLGWTFSRALPIRNADGEIVEWFGAASDITARKQAESALRAAKAEAEQANRAKSRFLAAASHDLRQPLSALTLYVTLLKSRVSPAGLPMLDSMKDCVASLSDLLTDLLDLSKLEAGIVVPKVSDFSVADLLESLVSVHAPEAAIKGLRLRYLPSKLTARTDPVLFKRLVGNFLANAVRYTERGGVLIACRRRQGKNWVEVWDTGVGIPAEKTTEIFDEFLQLDDGARNRGSGLGLAIVARMATLLGLAIRVQSRPGRGSMFAVELPLGEAPEVLAMAPTLSQRRTLRVALVEDNAMVRNALAAALADVGHDVVAVGSGQELHHALGNLAPDIVVSDYRLAHGETGFAVITGLRASVNADLPAILITGDTDPELLRSMADRGIAMLHKPVDLDTLLISLEKLTAASK